MTGREEDDYMSFGPSDKQGASELGCKCVRDEEWPPQAKVHTKPQFYRIFHVRKTREGVELYCPSCQRGVLLKGEIVDIVPIERVDYHKP